jgi:hypothetical protein
MKDRLRTWGFPLLLLSVTGFFLFLFIQNYRSTHCGSDVIGMTQRADGSMEVSSPCGNDPLITTYNVDGDGVTRSKRP